jgi:hypothetical protein
VWIPSSFEKDQRRELLVLDTGPIRELVLFHAVHYFRFQSLNSDLKFILRPESYDQWVKFIREFRRKTTSASVVCEINRWIRKTATIGHLKLWKRVYDEFRDMSMDEEVVKLVDMDTHSVARWGPVDVSLLEIAKRQAHLSPVVLTVDLPLYGEGQQAGLRVQLIQDLLG